MQRHTSGECGSKAGRIYVARLKDGRKEKAILLAAYRVAGQALMESRPLDMSLFRR